MSKLSPKMALAKDVLDVKLRAARWRDGKRISKQIYDEACGLLNGGACPQAVAMALMDLAFVKRGALAPADPLATFRGTVENQQERIIWWTVRHFAEAADEMGNT